MSARPRELWAPSEFLCGLRSTTRCCRCSTGWHRGTSRSCRQRIASRPIAEEAWSEEGQGQALAPECKQAHGEELHGDDGEDHGHHISDNHASLFCCGTCRLASRNGQRTCCSSRAQAAQVCHRARPSLPWTRSCGSSPPWNPASRWYCSQPGACSAPRSHSPDWSCLQPESRSATCAHCLSKL